MDLRWYQEEAVRAVFDNWAAGVPGGYLISLPTGSGKSLVIARLCELLNGEHGARILMLTHSKELVQQNFDELLMSWPLAPAGIYSVSITKAGLNEMIVFAGVQSMANVFDQCGEFDIIIIDECHRIGYDDGSQYRTILNHHKDARLIGLTASPYRMTTGMLTGGENPVFDSLIYEAPILRLINNGYLCNLITKGASVEINTDGLKHSGGEFNKRGLELRCLGGDTTNKAVENMVARGKDRNCWLIFASGIEHAKVIMVSLIFHGINAAMVTGQTPKSQRDDLISDHKSGKIKALVNVDILTTGYNNRRIDLIACLRPTESPGLWVQILGRGLRTHESKGDCLVLDYSGNAKRFGPIDMIRPKAKNEGSGDGITPSKECPECWSIIAAGFRVCPDCGYEFPDPEKKIEKEAQEAALLSNQVEPKKIKIDSTEFILHAKPGKTPCVKIQYNVGMFRYYDWLFPESKYKSSYIKLCVEFGAKPWPSAQLFIDHSDELEGPEYISVVPDCQYFKVVSREFYLDDVPF
jgi:DNA repair protein RadD